MNLPASAEDFSFSEDGRWIVVADADHVAKVWDATEISPQRLIAHLALDQPLKSIAVSHTGEHIAAVAGDGIVYLWKLNGDRGDFSDLSLLQVQGTYLITHNALQNNIFLGSSKIIDTRTQTIDAATFRTMARDAIPSIDRSASPEMALSSRAWGGKV